MLSVRQLALAVLGFVLVGCGDQIARPMEPRTNDVEAEIAALSVNDIRAMINALIATPSDRGVVNGEFGTYNSLVNGGDMTLIQAQAQVLETKLLDILHRYQTDNSLLTPGNETAELAILKLLHAIYEFGGLQYTVPLPAGDDLLALATQQPAIIEHSNRVAALLIAANAFKGPTLVTIKKGPAQVSIQSDPEFKFKYGFLLHGDVYDITASSSPEFVTVSFCVELPNSGLYRVFHEEVVGEPADSLPLTAGHSCHHDPVASLPEDASLFARAMHSAGEFLSSLVAPRPLYAVHAGLAGHSGGSSPLSRFAIGKLEYSVSVAKIDSPNFYTAGTNTLSFRRQNFTFEFWLAVKRNGVDYSCSVNSASKLQAIIRRTGQNALPAVQAVGCETVGGKSTFKVVLSNPARPTAITGIINIVVDGVAATPVPGTSIPTFNFNTF